MIEFITGQAGSGKTTLTKMLAQHYGWTAQFEAVDYNPYLEDYYKDIPRWSFNLEVYFLKQRFKDLLELSHSENSIIQDRSIYEGVYVFTTNNHRMGNLSDRDFNTYMELFDNMTDILRYPDLMIYLRASVPHLVQNIQKRGRDYEQSMPIDYLRNLNHLYEDFIYEKYRGRTVVIDVDNLDFKNRTEDFAHIIDKIDTHLFSLFPE